MYIGPVDIIGFTTRAVAVGSANAAISGANSDARNTVLLISNTNCYWNTGVSSVTATSSDKYLPANTPLMVRLPTGHDNIGVIRDTADGVLSIYLIG